MTALETYQSSFANLRTDKARSRWPEFTRHRAPHKPLLLMAVMDLYAQGALMANLIELDEDLGELFTLYWSQVFPPHTGKRGNIAMPFWHLQSEGFWHLLPRPGQEEVLAGGGKIHSISRIQELALGARLDEPLYDVVGTDNGRFQLRETLLQTYFTPPVQEALRTQTAVNVQAYQYSLDLLDDNPPTIDETKPEYEPVRDQGFRRAVTTAYQHRCAFCGLRILTPDGHTAIEAAHIIPWAESHDDAIHNGLALCRLCHWGFDEGLVTINGRYRLRTSSHLTRDGNDPKHLAELNGRSLHTPAADRHHPHESHLSWHRRRVFRR